MVKFIAQSVGMMVDLIVTSARSQTIPCIGRVVIGLIPRFAQRYDLLNKQWHEHPSFWHRYVLFRSRDLVERMFESYVWLPSACDDCKPSKAHYHQMPDCSGGSIAWVVAS